MSSFCALSALFLLSSTRIASLAENKKKKSERLSHGSRNLPLHLGATVPPPTCSCLTRSLASEESSSVSMSLSASCNSVSAEGASAWQRRAAVKCEAPRPCLPHLSSRRRPPATYRRGGLAAGAGLGRGGAAAGKAELAGVKRPRALVVACAHAQQRWLRPRTPAGILFGLQRGRRLERGEWGGVGASAGERAPRLWACDTTRRKIGEQGERARARGQATVRSGLCRDASTGPGRWRDGQGAISTSARHQINNN